MKSSNCILLLLLTGIAIGSCKKNTHTPVVRNSLTIPWNVDSLFPTLQTTPLQVRRFSDVSGVLAAGKIAGTLTDISGNIINYSRNWENAVFTSPANTYCTNAGNVSVNSVPLSTLGFIMSSSSHNFYMHFDSATVWNESAANRWFVSGSDTIPAFAADVDGAYPSFSGTLPVFVSTRDGVSLTFNSTNTINGDSAFMAIYYYGELYMSNTVGTNGGTASISARRLTGAVNGFEALNASSSSDPVYYGGFIEIIIYNHTIQTFGGKQFAFVKLREVLGVVSFY